MEERPLVNAVDVSSARAAAFKTLQGAAQRCEKAKLQAGVDIARKGFIKKLWGVASAGLVLAAAALASAASLGAATPFLAVACVQMALAIGDAGCAWMTHRNALAEQQHAPVPYPRVTMGGNCLSNLIHQAVRPSFKSPESARKFATGFATFLRCGLMTANFSLGWVSPLHLAAAATAVKSAGAAIKLVLSGHTLTHAQNTRAKAPHALELLKKEGETSPYAERLVKAMVLDLIKRAQASEGLSEVPGPAALEAMSPKIDKAMKPGFGSRFETGLTGAGALGSGSQLAKLAPLEVWADELSQVDVTGTFNQIADSMAAWMDSIPPADAWADALSSLVQ